jgi:CheY-like chemotaxis protein
MKIDPVLPAIVTVDDNLTDVFFLERRLRAANVNNPLHHLEDGFAAIEWFETVFSTNVRNFPWLVFVDLKMPRMDGFEVLRWLRNRGLLEQMTVVVLSTSDEPVDMARAATLGAHRFLVKYPQPEVLREVAEFAAQRCGSSALHQG